MKDPKAWELDDLHELIATQAEESSTLEFKQGQVLEDLSNKQLADRRKEEISKDVSAFANRIGGVIVYGMEEDSDEPHPAKDLRPINPTKCSKERLEQIIASRIKPPIQNLAIQPIRIGSDRYVYVVKIPASHTAHQASDKRYYKRINFGNQVLEDDEIRQIMHRQTRPTYHVRLETSMTGRTEVRISGNVQNTSVMTANDVSAVLLLPNELARSSGVGTEMIDGNAFIRMLNDLNARMTSQLKPFEYLTIHLGRACKIPDTIPSLTVPLFLRVYDQFGHAHEAEFKMSLSPDTQGRIIGERQQERDANP